MSSLNPGEVDFDDDHTLGLLNALPSMALVLDDEFNVEFANQSFCGLVDQPREDVTDTKFLRFLPKKTAGEVQRHLEQLSPETSKFSWVIDGIPSETDGQCREWTFQLDTADSGDDERYYVFARDVNKPPRKEQNAEPQQTSDLNERTLRTMTNSIQEAFWLIDAEWSNVLYANRTCEDIYGVPKEELLQDVDNWVRHIVQEDADRMYTNLAPENIEDLDESKNVSFRIDHPEKGRRHIDLEISPIPEKGKTKRLVGLASDATEKKEKLQQSQRKFEAIFNSTVSMIGLLAPDGTVVEVNQSALEMIDEAKEETLGEPFWDTPWWNTESLRQRMKEAVEKAADGEFVQFEATNKLPDGTRVCIDMSFTPIENEHGEVQYVVPEGRDITAQKKLEEELEEQRNFLDSLINAAQQGIFVKNWDGEYILANDTVSEVFGVPRQEIEGNTDYDFLDDEKAQKFHEADQQVLESGKPFQYEVQMPHAKQDQERTFLTTKTPLFKDRPPEERMVLGITTDISKRKSLERELEKQKDYLQTILDSATNLIFVKDWDGVFQIANEAVAHVYDTTPEELIGQTDADVNPNENEVETFREEDREVMRSGEIKEISEEPVTDLRTGETHWFQTTKVPLFTDRSVEDRQVLGVATDITEKKTIREQLEQSLQEKEMLLGEIHHRVKNNLQIIQSILSMEIRESNEDNSVLEDCINRIYSMALLHEKLYQSDTLDKGDIASYFEDLSQHLKGAVGTEAQSIDVSLSVNLDTIPIKDAVSCGLVVNELVTNALQHGFSDGEEGLIDISFRGTADGYEITVEDNGHGLPEGVNITDVESTGMRIIRSIVEYEFQGTINFYDNNGVKVTISL